MSGNPASIKALRKNHSLPIVSFVSAMLLVSGQLLNCCQVNESLSGMIAKVVRTAVFFHSHEADHHSEQGSHSHPSCHSHGLAESADAASQDSLPAESGQRHFEAHETCLSEHAFVIQAQPSNNQWQADLPTPARLDRGEGLVIAPVRIERPRPQNKAGPPVYLLTLRLLV